MDTCAQKQIGGRFLALDALRGLSVFLMLLVNNFGVGPDTPKFLMHAQWSGGVRLADFVFPWFLYCVGVAIPFSVASARKRAVPVWRYDLRSVRRVILLIALGVLVSSAAEHGLDFTLGTLALIGLSYAAGSLLYDLPAHRRAIIALLMLAAYWVVIKFLPNPGVHAGAFDEGRNIIHHINQKYLAPLNLDGLPLVIPTSALVMIGSLIGDLTRTDRISRNCKASVLAGCGAALVLAGYLWSFSIPFNKPLWTSSYVLFAAGTATIMLGIFHFAIDMRGRKIWAYPLLVFGSNAIVVYVAPIVFKSLVLHPVHISTGGWLRSLGYAAFWWIILWVLYRKRLFLKV
ncbi:MAG: DUF5009 domain-containing protein [Armatimonadota bacterium]